MTPEHIRELLARKERESVEFKEARTDLPRNLFESICAFLNRDGGTVLLGVRNDGSVAGVDQDAVERLSADIVNLSNNPQKLDPPFIISPLVITYDDNTHPRFAGSSQFGHPSLRGRRL